MTVRRPSSGVVVELDVTATRDTTATRDIPVDTNGDVAGRLFVALALLTRRLRRGDPTPLGPGSISALATVVADGPMRLGDLAAVEGVRAPTMTRIVDLLVADGNAERVPDPADGRACLVRATGSGAAMVAGARTTRSDLLMARLSRLDPDDVATLRAALPVIEALCVDDVTDSVDTP